MILRQNFVTFSLFKGIVALFLRLGHFCRRQICQKFYFLPKLNYNKNADKAKKRVTMLGKGYINLHKKFLGLRQYVSRYHHFEQKLRNRL